MTESVKEMAINLPIMTPPVVASTVTQASSDSPESMVVGSPNAEYDPSKISVWANNITLASNTNMGGADTAVDSIAVFDVVFSVGIDCGNGVTKTYQVVKRIGIDKCKIACEAACTTPVSIVESKTEEAKARAAEEKKRFRTLAGLA